MKKRTLFGIAAVGALLVSGFMTSAASATEVMDRAGDSTDVLLTQVELKSEPTTENTLGENSQVALIAQQDGHPVVVGENTLELKEAPPAEVKNDELSPHLINFDQWFRCFSLNQAEDVFDTYSLIQDGSITKKYLRCGNEVNGSGWGYKHIRAGHEQDWQNQYDRAVSLGWEPDAQGIDSWDDVMSAGASNSLSYWSWRGPVTENQTRCYIGNLTFVRMDPNTGSWTPLYDFNVRTAVATNSSRVITTFPTTATAC